MRIPLFLLLAGCIASTTLADEPVADIANPAVEEAGEQIGSVWMRKKMDYSQAILKGMAMGDFDAIKTNAARMRLLNTVESFARSRSANYRWHTRVFENTCKQIAAHAEDENLPGVTLAFNQLTVNCVNCHQSIRGGAKVTDVENE